MLVSMRELLVRAKDGKYAVAAANVFTGRTVEACFAAASEMKAPVIIACTPYVQMEELLHTALQQLRVLAVWYLGAFASLALLSFIMKKSMRS